MAENAELSDNHRKLVEAGVIPTTAELTSAENKVIAGLSDDEVNTLIKIRARLGEAMAEEGGATRGAADDVSSNFVI